MDLKWQLTAIKEIKNPTIKVPKGMGKGRPSSIRNHSIRKYGPKFLRRYADPILGVDYCQPWPEFVTATTSLSEQMLYAAFAIFFKDPVQYWKPPFVGGVNWKYQTNLHGGRLFKGGQVCDFQVTYGTGEMCIRLQSERWHVMAEHAKQVDDFYNKTHTQGMIIRDIYEQDFIADCTLRAAVAVVAKTLTTGENASPIAYGTARQVRR
jgi:hypothetical protein